MSNGMPSTRLWTRAEYIAIAEAGIFTTDEHTELIEGEILRMSPQNRPHITAVTLTKDVLYRIFDENYTIQVQGPLAVNDISEPEPDVAVLTGSPRDYRESHPKTALLIVEVSDSTLAYDRSQKTSLYAKAGIKDYWILNLVQRRLEVYRQPVEMPEEPFGYGYAAMTIYFPTDSVASLAAPESEVAVADLLP
jgi:Uma2 family endonuclease